MIDIILNYYTFSLFFGGFAALITGAIVISHRRDPANITWFLATFTSAVWSLGYLVMATTTSRDVAAVSNLVLHMAAILVPMFYLLSVLHLTKTVDEHRSIFISFAAASFFFLALSGSDLFVTNVLPKGPFNFVPDAGPAYIYFTLYFFAIVLYVLGILLQHRSRVSDPILRKRYNWMIWFSVLGFAGGGSVFFLTFNVPINPVILILFSLYPIASTYAVFRYQLFDIRTVATEGLVFSLWFFIGARILFLKSFEDKIIETALLLITIIFGIFLIRNVMKEVRQKDEIEKLAENLAAANESLRELDKTKSEFISLATHQIRSPLTAIKGYASLLLDGDYGDMSPQQHEVVKIIFDSSQNLVVIVNEFLDISRIELGRMKYDKSKFDLGALAKETVEELLPNVAAAGLTIELGIEEGREYPVFADKNKVEQVISNLIDNGVKYTRQGGITLRLSKRNGRILLTIQDTGVGIDPAEKGKLFEKFIRAKDAHEVNVTGTGLGLYIARQMIEAQGGRIWVDSEGKGKGTTFSIELLEA